MVHSPSTVRVRLETLKPSSFSDAHGRWKPATSKASSSGQIEPVRAQISDGVVDVDPVSVNRRPTGPHTVPWGSDGPAGAAGTSTMAGRTTRVLTSREVKAPVGVRPHPFE